MQVTCESDGLCRVGWATRAAAYEIGKDKRSFGFGSTGKKSHGGSFEDYGKAFGKVSALRILQCMQCLKWKAAGCTSAAVASSYGCPDTFHII